MCATRPFRHTLGAAERFDESRGASLVRHAPRACRGAMTRRRRASLQSPSPVGSTQRVHNRTWSTSHIRTAQRSRRRWQKRWRWQWRAGSGDDCCTTHDPVPEELHVEPTSGVRGEAGGQEEEEASRAARHVPRTSRTQRSNARPHHLHCRHCRCRGAPRVSRSLPRHGARTSRRGRSRWRCVRRSSSTCRAPQNMRPSE